MSNMNDFVIENGVLKKYVGPGGDVVIPEGVTEIGSLAFWYGSAGKKVTSVLLPLGLTRIGRNAFSGCAELKYIVLPDSLTELGDSVCINCSSLEVVFLEYKQLPIIYRLAHEKMSLSLVVQKEDSYAYFAFASKKGFALDNIREWICKEKWSEYDQDLLNNGPEYKYQRTARILGALGRLVSPIELTEDNRQQYTTLLNKNLKALVQLAELLHCPRIIKDVMSLGILNTKTEKTFRKLLSASSDPDIVSLAVGEAILAETDTTNTVRSQKSVTNTSKSELDKLMATLIEGKAGEKSLREKLKNDYSLTLTNLPELKETNGTTVSSPLVLAWLLTAHGMIELPDPDEDDEYPEWFVQEYPELFETDVEDTINERNPFLDQTELRPEAKKILEYLDQKSLQQALLKLSEENLGGKGRSKKTFLSYPICRYADEELMNELVRRAVKWSPLPLTVFRESCLYSNTRSAMLFIEKSGMMVRYASLRGTDADTIRDKHLSDVGLDEKGSKAYALGNQTVTARLQKDMSFLVELPNGKIAKSLPKKGADAEKYEAAKKDFAEMKKSVKKILKNRGKVLFQDFLSGKKRSAEDWQGSYLHNPLLREAASLVVWAQGKKTFTLMDGAPVNSAEQPYTITDKPILVAHPMEMKEAETKAWQKYFTSHGLKQPFAQVWEPVRKAEDIKEDRYKDCMIPYYRFLNQEKHGITVEDNDFHNEIYINLDECDTDIERIDWHRHAIYSDDRFEVQTFKFKKYSRQVNHIVAYLDRVTVWDRVRKDDVSVMDMIDGFTLAQITDFIAAAQEANAHNVLAALLEYKNNNFSDFDPMDEFTLEW